MGRLFIVQIPRSHSRRLSLKGKFNELTSMSSCLADHTKLEALSSSEDSQNKLASSEKSRVRRSAAMIGLAISMGASGMLLSQDKAAIAANGVTAETEISSLPNFSDLPSEGSQLSPLALKHKVEEGDTITRLAYNYQVKPEEIAAMNNLPLAAKLEPGETIKIPSDKDSSQKITPKSSPESSINNKSVGTKSVNTSLDHLRKTRKRLQDSLAELKTEEANSNVETIEVAEAIEIPVFSRETELEQITVKEETEETSSLKVSILEEEEQSILPMVPSLQPQTTAKLEEDQPIPIKVVPAQEETPRTRQSID